MTNRNYSKRMHVKYFIKSLLKEVPRCYTYMMHIFPYYWIIDHKESNNKVMTTTNNLLCVGVIHIRKGDPYAISTPKGCLPSYKRL
jgi:hypothetical protein